ncbi:Zn-ribbon domain-containing OB-fold protein [Patulibacter minatonensis]|uniref:Zn-ribbon domain-containing OB-fold protein n=1 Tax=Patulibacter minatonensis TaxID=298163 RepID=UPI0004BAB4EF|nr:OB-fold domain-containing protein [Patulibacter minatonensis]
MSAETPGVPVAEDLFEQGADGVGLIGTRCAGCGAHYFPVSLSCRNPVCDDKRTVRTTLGRTGTLYSWTVQHYRPPALYRADEWEPYAVGLVEVPEGLRVLAKLIGRDTDALEVGMPVRLVTSPLYTDADGRRVDTYAYEITGDGIGAGGGSGSPGPASSTDGPRA